MALRPMRMAAVLRAGLAGFCTGGGVGMRGVGLRSAGLTGVGLIGIALGGLGSAGVSVAQTPGPSPTDNHTVQWAAALVAPGGVKQGSDTTLELSGEIEDGWHVYALTEPPGGPTALRVTLDENEVALVSGTPTGTPPRTRHDPSFGLQTQFYTHSFKVRVPVQVKPRPAAGRQVLPVSVRFQTCSDRECQPPTTVHLAVPVEVLPDA